MQILYSVPEQGQLFVVLQRRYVVTDVRQALPLRSLRTPDST
jgi:hypothetical protein